MSFDIIPKNPEAGILGKPNGFWCAFFVDTPIAELTGCKYTGRGIIHYEHDGFLGAWFTEEEALEMHEILLEYVNTDDYENHWYFSTRKDQMEAMLDFLPLCGGFKREW